MPETRFSCDGRLVVGIAGESTVRLFDALTDEMLHEKVFESKEHIRFVRFADKNNVLVALASGEIRQWDVDRDRVTTLKRSESLQINDILISPTGRLFIDALNNRYRFRDVSGETKFEVEDCVTVILSDTWKFAAFIHIADQGKNGRKTDLYDLEKGKFLYSINDAEGLIFSHDGRLIFLFGTSDVARISLAESGNIIKLLGGRGASGGCFSPDGKFLATYDSHSASVEIWNALDGGHIRTIDSKYGDVRDVKFSPSNISILVSTSDYSLHIWDVLSGLERATLQHGGFPAVFSPGGRIFATQDSAHWKAYTRAHVDGPFGFLSMPSFWLSLGLGVMCILSLAFDFHNWNRIAYKRV